MAANGESHGKKADPEVQKDVEEMMLDYFLYKATEALLTERQAMRDASVPSTMEADMQLNMVDSALVIFAANHGHDAAAASSLLRYRLELLRFTALFTRRFFRSSSTPSESALTDLRDRVRRRAASWLSRPAAGKTGIPCSDQPEFEPYRRATPLDELVTDLNTAHVLNSCNISYGDQSKYYGEKDSVSLLDTLPIFIALTATVTRMNEDFKISDEWMELAAEYMQQAALEQYLIYGAQGPGPLREAFAWGYDEDFQGADDSPEAMVNDMFHGDGKDVIEAWDSLRTRTFQTFLPPRSVDLGKHLQDLAIRLPVHEFEGKIMAFLQGFLTFQSRPVLLQLETGRLEGLSREETKAFKARVGL